MKKIILSILSVILISTTAKAEIKKEVIIFSQPCHYCEKLKEALDNGIKANNPDISFVILDILEEKNNKLLREFASKYKLRGNIGLPLLFVGDNYMMGWGEKAPEQLQGYIEELKSETTSRIPVSVLLEKI